MTPKRLPLQQNPMFDFYVPTMKILLVDNYDSFTYNLVNILRKNKKTALTILQPHEIALEQVRYFDKILFSPGPDIPATGDVMEKIIGRYKEEKSMLGICLGMEAIALFFGARLLQLPEPSHGVVKRITVTDGSEPLFRGVDSPFDAGLYHSWKLDPETLPPEIKVTAVSNQGVIMSVRHAAFDLAGFQFHPESVMTREGEKMLNNWAG